MDIDLYKKRREKLKQELLNNKGLMILPSASHMTRSNDTEFGFRQNSNFYYLCGHNEAESILVLSSESGELKTTLFLLDSDKKSEQWTGRRLGVANACQTLGVDQAFAIDQFKDKMQDLIPGHQSLYFDIWSEHSFLKTFKEICHGLLARRRAKVILPKVWRDSGPLLGQMRLYKEEAEIELIKKAVNISTKAHHAAMALCQADKNEAEIKAIMEFIFHKNGANGEAYGSIVAGGVNANILHYVENNQKLQDGDLLLIDAGCEYGIYASDITRTFPVNGVMTRPQQDVYNIILKAEKECIQMAAPGNTLEKIHQHAIKVLTQGLIDLAILSGSLSENIEQKNYAKYYPHGTGHWLGMDVHDQCPYNDETLDPLILKEGMVFTVEPGLYLPSDDTSIPEKYRGIGIRIEDDILITKTGHNNLTASIVKEIAQMQEIYESDYRDYL